MIDALRLVPSLVLIAASVGCASNTSPASSTSSSEWSAPEASRPKPSVKFDGQRYALSHVDTRGKGTINEYLREGESTGDWDQMLTISESRGAEDLFEYTKHYIDSIKAGLAMEPQVFVKEGEAVMVVAFIVAPDRSHAEFTIFRAVLVPNIGIRSYGFSKKMPYAKEVDATEIMNKKDRWIDQIIAMNAAPVRD